MLAFRSVFKAVLFLTKISCTLLKPGKAKIWVLFLPYYKNRTLIAAELESFFGPSDRDRTCGLMVPNHARYQLRHTRKSQCIITQKDA